MEKTEDGWSKSKTRNVRNVLSQLYDANYEIENCIRGCYTGAYTYKELGNFLSQLADDLKESAEELRYEF